MDGKVYLVSTAVGATLGAVVGYLCFTRSGRDTLQRARTVVEQLTTEVERARPLWLKIRLAMEEYRQDRALSPIFNAGESESSRRTESAGMA